MKLSVMTLALVTLVLSAPSCARHKTKETAKETQQKPKDTTTITQEIERAPGTVEVKRRATVVGGEAVPEGFIVVEETLVADIREIPFALLNDARAEVKLKNYEKAAAEIEGAARIFKAEAKHAAQGDHLAKAANNLEDVAKRVKKGEITSDEELTKAFAQAAQADAQHHRLKAAAEWSEQLGKRAGHDLMAAARATEHGAAWVGKEVVKGVDGTVKETRVVAGKLIAGTGDVTADVGKAIDSLGVAIVRIGHGVEPSKKAE